MIKGVSRFAAVTAAILATGISFAEEAVLYWMVDDTAKVTTGGGEEQDIRIFFGNCDVPDSANRDFAARIRVTGGNISGETYLGLYYIDPDDGSIVIDSGALGVDFYELDSGYWGAGVPTGNQSPSGAYSAGTPEYSFIVELGNVTWDANSGTASWVRTVAVSESASYSSLGAFIGQTFDINPPATGIWIPTSFHEVPEPSGGLLMLIGGALLALRRRRNGGD